MDGEAKKKNTEIIKSFAESLLSFEDGIEFRSLKGIEALKCKFLIKNMIADLVSSGRFRIVTFEHMQDMGGNWIPHLKKVKRIMACIEWIKENLDVWDIEEIDPTVDLEKERNFHRRFQFVLKD